jgi:nicotinamidase-related amidase
MTKTLLIIDVQKEYEKGGVLEINNIKQPLENILKLLAYFRKNNLNIIHVQHIAYEHEKEYGFANGTKGVEFIKGFNPKNNEIKITKHLPSSFEGTNLDKYLKDNNIDELYICGFSSFLCCDTTARYAYHKGYNVNYIEDAIGEFDIEGFKTKDLHEYTNAVLEACGFANIVKTKDII